MTTTSTDQHLQGYDRFNLHPHSLKCIKYRLYICIIISYMNKSPNTPPNRTLHQKLSCFIQFVEFTPPKLHHQKNKPKPKPLLDNTNTNIPHILGVTNHLTHPPCENSDATTHLQKPFRFHFDALGKRCC